jgi:hypothetical protein
MINQFTLQTMNKLLKNTLLVIPVVVIMMTGLYILPQSVAAQGNSGSNIPLGVCTFIPAICDAISGQEGSSSLTPQDASKFLQDRLRTVLSFVFIGIILISVFIILRAGIKYIQSQGDPGKIAEAQKAIQSVFVGFAVLFVGIIGLVLILAFFNITGLTDTTTCTINAEGALVCPEE